jgi:predicted secreted protein
LEVLMKKVFILPFLVILLAGCTTATPTPAAGTRPVLTDPATPIEAQAGDTFHIIIAANPSTGYQWQIVGELDGDTVEFVSRDYTADEPVIPGSGGVDVWTFRGISAGETQITLGSYPPSLDPTGPEQTITFRVTIR